MNDTPIENKPEEKPETGTEQKPEQKKSGNKTRRILRRILKFLFWTLLLLVVLAVALFIGGVIYWNWYLPELIETRLLPPVREQFGLDEMELKIRRIGLTGLDLETFALTGEDGRRLSFDSIRADYTPHLPFRTPRALDIVQKRRRRRIKIVERLIVQLSRRTRTRRLHHHLLHQLLLRHARIARHRALKTLAAQTSRHI